MIILINGSINSGKSTVARLLSKKLPRPATIEIDSLHAFIDWVSIEDSIPLNLENALSIIRNFVSRDFNVIVPYPLTSGDYEFLRKGLESCQTKTVTVTLRPNINKAQQSTSDRILAEWEVERIAYHYSSGLVDPEFGSIIDNTHQNPEETANAILEIVGHI